MTWEEYYENYYDWAESTAIKKLSSVDMLGNTDEVTELQEKRLVRNLFSHGIISRTLMDV